VRVVRLTIAPDNTASLRLARELAFVQVGQQWDEEDGQEIIYEMPVLPPDSHVGGAGR